MRYDMELKNNRSASVILGRYRELYKIKKEIEKVLLKSPNLFNELDYSTIWKMKERLNSLQKGMLIESKKFKKETGIPIEIFLGETENDNRI